MKPITADSIREIINGIPNDIYERCDALVENPYLITTEEEKSIRKAGEKLHALFEEMRSYIISYLDTQVFYLDKGIVMMHGATPRKVEDLNMDIVGMTNIIAASVLGNLIRVNDFQRTKRVIDLINTICSDSPTLRERVRDNHAIIEVAQSRIENRVISSSYAPDKLDNRVKELIHDITVEFEMPRLVEDYTYKIRLEYNSPQNTVVLDSAAFIEKANTFSKIFALLVDAKTTQHFGKIIQKLNVEREKLSAIPGMESMIVLVDEFINELKRVSDKSAYQIKDVRPGTLNEGLFLPVEDYLQQIRNQIDHISKKDSGHKDQKMGYLTDAIVALTSYKMDHDLDALMESLSHTHTESLKLPHEGLKNRWLKQASGTSVVIDKILKDIKSIAQTVDEAKPQAPNRFGSSR